MPVLIEVILVIIDQRLAFGLEKGEETRQIREPMPLTSRDALQRRSPCAIDAVPPQPQEIRVIGWGDAACCSRHDRCSLTAVASKDIIAWRRSQNAPKRLWIT